MTSFINVRLDDDIERGAQDTTDWDVDITPRDRRKREQRNLRSVDPTRTYDISYGLDDMNKIYDVKAFFKVMRGSWFSFPFKDWSDFNSASSVESAISNTDQPLIPIHEEGDTTTATWQIIKRYSLPGLAADKNYDYVVTKPIASTVVVGGTSVSFSVNDLTGIITFSRALSIANPLTCGFEYNVPVRLSDSSVASLTQLRENGEIPSIQLIEVFGENEEA